MTNFEYAHLILEIVQLANKLHDLSGKDWRTSEQLDVNGSVTIEFVVDFLRKHKEEREYTEDHIYTISSIFEMIGA